MNNISYVVLNICILSSASCMLIFFTYFLSFFLIYLFIHSFIFGCFGSSLLCAGFLQLRRAGATLHCHAQASHCSGFFCCKTWAPGARASVVVARGLQSTSSVVVDHGPSCSAACGILPDQGTNLCSLHWQADSKPPCHRGSPTYFQLGNFFLIYLFYFYFWLCWGFVAGRGLSLVAASGGYSPLRCTGFSLRWLILLWSTGSRCTGFSSCGMWAQQLWLVGSRVQAQQVWCTGLVALQHVGSSRTRA